MVSQAFTKKDYFTIFFLWGIVILVFYPLFYSEYIYTDEVVQLWMYKRGSNFQMSTANGRFITDKLCEWVFNPMNTVRNVTYARLFSLGGWLLAIPVWYYIVKKMVVKEKLPEPLVFFSVLYLVCSPQFCICVSWAACFQLFLANTAGLISGYLFYSGIRNENNRTRLSAWHIIASVTSALISLFSYQNGFGCFLLPFLLSLIGTAKISRTVVIGLVSYLLICLIYYLLFKYGLKANGMEASPRADLYIHPYNKIKFLFKKVLASSFHFTYIFNEKNSWGFILYRILLVLWIIAVFIQQRKTPVLQRVAYVALTGLFCVFIYLPSLLVKEYYASNRTLLALNMAVFFVVACTVLNMLKNKKHRSIVVATVSVLFIINAWFNFNKLFLSPIKNEYKVLGNYIRNNYNDSIHTVYFIRPSEDFFVRKYGITRSWDEFGVPSSFFKWVPPFFVKQIVFEEKKDRASANKIITHSWLGMDEFRKSGVQPENGVLVIDAEKILMNDEEVTNF